jgi:hypothetical protein
VTAPLALAAGASGVGVGSAVNKLNSDIAMLAAVRQVGSYPFTFLTRSPLHQPQPLVLGECRVPALFKFSRISEEGCSELSTGVT